MIQRQTPPGSNAQRFKHEEGVRTWTTDTVPRGQRLDYWIDAISDALFCMSTTTRAADDVTSRLTTFPLGAVQVVFAEGSGQTSFRTRSLLARGGARSYHLLGDFRSPWVLVWNGAKERMSAGELVLTDSDHVHGGMFSEGCAVTNLSIPPAWLRTWLADPDGLVGRRIDRRLGWGSALSAFVSQASPSRLASTTVPRPVISDQIGALLALVESERSGSTLHRRRSDLEIGRRASRVAERVRERLDDPWLDAVAVADAMDVSPTTLHHWLADAGDTFGSLLERQRMALASDMLMSRRCDRLSVSEIGSRVGVPDARKLARLMRLHFGESPSAHRQSSKAPTPPIQRLNAAR